MEVPMAEIKFSDEEMSQLKKLQDGFNSLVLQFGQLRVEEFNLERTTKRLAELKGRLDSEYSVLLDAEKKLSAELNAKYGDGVLDPRTGIFTPTPKANQ
jgi:hypothetical protein